MKKIAIIAGIAALAASTTGFAQQRPQRAPAADITRAQASAQADQQFAGLDLNRDGQLTPEEVRQALQQRMAERRQRMEQRLSQLTPEQRAQVEQRRAERVAARGGTAGPGRLDRGRLGRGGPGGALAALKGPISLAQFRELSLQRFDRLDADRNGILSPAEQQRPRMAPGAAPQTQPVQ